MNWLGWQSSLWFYPWKQEGRQVIIFKKIRNTTSKRPWLCQRNFSFTAVMGGKSIPHLGMPKESPAWLSFFFLLLIKANSRHICMLEASKVSLWLNAQLLKIFSKNNLILSALSKQIFLCLSNKSSLLGHVCSSLFLSHAQKQLVSALEMEKPVKEMLIKTRDKNWIPSNRIDGEATMGGGLPNNAPLAICSWSCAHESSLLSCLTL